MKSGLNAMDRFAMAISPRWGANRLRARLIAETLARHYEAASGGRRTANWPRAHSDANVAAGASLAVLRAHARDLVRNNGWAVNALRTVTTNVVGWGIKPKADGPESKKIAGLWKKWGETTECDADGRLTFYGIEKLAVRTTVEAGEVLVRRRRRRPEDGLTIPMQLQVLEPDFIDTSKDGLTSMGGGPIIQGIEFDKLGRRVAYWLFDQHPGSARLGNLVSKRIPAEDIIHLFDMVRPGQVRGPSWFAPAVVTLKDFDEYEDATLMRQKIAACFAAFVTDVDGNTSGMGEQDSTDPLIETLEPGLVANLPPGKDVKFGNPPLAGDDGFTVRQLRRIAAAVGVTYEDLSGDYSQVNFSSARMSRIRHWALVEDWRWNMLIPLFCDVAWGWAMEAAELAGEIEAAPTAGWTANPMPMIEPDREALAAVRRIRGGLATVSEVIREQGGDPDAFLDEYAEDLKKLDARGIWLDSDVRRTSQAGLTQARVGGGGNSASNAAQE